MGDFFSRIFEIAAGIFIALGFLVFVLVLGLILLLFSVAS